MNSFKSFKHIAEAYVDMKTRPQTTNETFDTRARWESIFDTPPEKDVFVTTIGGQEVILSFDTEGLRDFISISFLVGGSSNITGGGSQNRIFGAIINKVIDFVKERRPKTIQFVSDGTPAEIESGSRTKLYKTLARKFATDYHLNVSANPLYGHDTFTLTRK